MLDHVIYKKKFVHTVETQEGLLTGLGIPEYLRLYSFISCLCCTASGNALSSSEKFENRIVTCEKTRI